jgi:two-component system chemotaxis response regulator CheB
VAPQRVLIVDDAAVVRRLLSLAVEADGRFLVAGLAADPASALRKARLLRPDAVILDVDLAGEDGLQVLVALRRELPQARIIMFSALTGRGSATTVEALLLGANSYALKPALVSGLAEAQAYVQGELLDRLAVLFSAGPASPLPVPAPLRPQPPESARPRLLAVAASTGGPAAVAALLRGLGSDFGLPVVLVQHMPPTFTPFFAERLNADGPLRVRQAADGDRLEPGLVLLAPGDRHLRLRGGAGGWETWLSDAPPVKSCRPAADVMLNDAAELAGSSTLAVVLTGMGQDGLDGCRRVSEAGGRILAQDEASSVVWGMPGSVAAAGLAESLAAPEALGKELRRLSGLAGSVGSSVGA